MLVTIPHSVICVIAYGPMFTFFGPAASANIFIFLERTTILQVRRSEAGSSSSSL
jgi:hypothetical protein